MSACSRTICARWTATRSLWPAAASAWCTRIASFSIICRCPTTSRCRSWWPGATCWPRSANLKELTSWVGLTARAGALPPELSGGERQRAALARAVIMSPDVVLADEPTGNIDWEMSQRLLRLLIELNRMGKTIMIATHDLALIRAAKTHVQARVLRISNRRAAACGGGSVMAGPAGHRVSGRRCAGRQGRAADRLHRLADAVQRRRDGVSRRVRARAVAGDRPAGGSLGVGTGAQLHRAHLGARRASSRRRPKRRSRCWRRRRASPRPGRSRCRAAGAAGAVVRPRPAG